MNERFRSFLNRAGFVNVSVRTALAVVGLVSVTIIFLVLATTKSIAISLAFYLCILLQLLDNLKTRISRYQLQQQMIWPNYLDALHSSIWSGSSFQEAVLDCARFAPRSAGWAFQELEKDLDSGLDLDTALLNLKTRLASPIADRFVEITRLALVMGGSGFLPGLKAQSAQLRLENSNWEEIKVKQSWVIASARLAVFAPWLVLILLSTRSETAAAFNTEVGMAILSVGLAASLFAFRLVRILAKLPERKRILVL